MTCTAAPEVLKAIDSMAVKEQRSRSQMVRILLEEALQARIAATRPSDAGADGKKAEKFITCTAHGWVQEAIDNMAEKERRSRSQMMRILLEEAVRARRSIAA